MWAGGQFPPVREMKVKKTSSADAKGRFGLGAKYANKQFRLSEQPNGNLVLEPMVTIHEREVWFYKNPEAQAMVQEGIHESQKRKVVSLGSFAEYADTDDDGDGE